MTKAGLLWECPYDAAFHYGLAHDCISAIGEKGCREFSGPCSSNPYLCIPAAEAREFLGEIIDIGEYAAVEAGSYGTPYDESAGKKLADKARELLAKLEEK